MFERLNDRLFPADYSRNVWMSHSRRPNENGEKTRETHFIIGLIYRSKVRLRNNNIYFYSSLFTEATCTIKQSTARKKQNAKKRQQDRRCWYARPPCCCCCLTDLFLSPERSFMYPGTSRSSRTSSARRAETGALSLLILFPTAVFYPEEMEINIISFASSAIKRRMRSRVIHLPHSTYTCYMYRYYIRT